MSEKTNVLISSGLDIAASGLDLLVHRLLNSPIGPQDDREEEMDRLILEFEEKHINPFRVALALDPSYQRFVVDPDKYKRLNDVLGEVFEIDSGVRSTFPFIPQGIIDIVISSPLSKYITRGYHEAKGGFTNCVSIDRLDDFKKDLETSGDDLGIGFLMEQAKLLHTMLERGMFGCYDRNVHVPISAVLNALYDQDMDEFRGRLVIGKLVRKAFSTPSLSNQILHFRPLPGSQYVNQYISKQNIHKFKQDLYDHILGTDPDFASKLRNPSTIELATNEYIRLSLILQRVYGNLVRDKADNQKISREIKRHEILGKYLQPMDDPAIGVFYYVPKKAIDEFNELLLQYKKGVPITPDLVELVRENLRQSNGHGQASVVPSVAEQLPEYMDDTTVSQRLGVQPYVLAMMTEKGVLTYHTGHGYLVIEVDSLAERLEGKVLVNPVVYEHAKRDGDGTTGDKVLFQLSNYKRDKRLKPLGIQNLGTNQQPFYVVPQENMSRLKEVLKITAA